MRNTTVCSVLLPLLIASSLPAAQVIRANAQAFANAPTPAAIASPTPVPMTHANGLVGALAPIPTKAPANELNQWLDTVNRQDIDPTELQQRVPTDALKIWLRQAWQQGADPDQVQAALQAADWQESTDNFQVVDIDGDGKTEWLLTLYLDPNPMQWGRSGDFWIIGDRIDYQFFEPTFYFAWATEEIPFDRDFSLTAPQLIHTADMTGDGLPDLVLQRQMCGAHTCTQAYFVLSMQNGTLQELVVAPQSNLDNSGGAIVMPYSEIQGYSDETGDGLPDFTIHGGMIGSAGAGIQRARTEVWAWDGNAITLAEKRWDATNYRYHILYEANENLIQGDRDRAQTLYLQAIEDESLDDEEWWPDTGAATIHDSVLQFAAFRLALMGLMESDIDQATEWQSWLKTTYPSASITQAADVLLNAWNAEPDLTNACQAVTNYLVPLEDPDADFGSNGPTGPLRYMGYGNPELSAKDVCPIDLGMWFAN